MTDTERRAQSAMDSLRRSVHEALDKKRRLGQYAVIWQDDKVVRLFEEEEEQRRQEDSKRE